MDVKNKLTRGLGRAKLGVIKYSPEILLAGGIISGAAALVLAIKETLKAEEILDSHNEKIDKIVTAREKVIEEEREDDYTLDDVKKDKAKAYIQTGWEFAKLYAPTAFFAGISLTCILTSHGIMRKRNIALASSLAVVRKAFDEYRGRVVRDLGSDMDRHFLYETVEKNVEVTEKDAKGKDKTKLETYTIPTAANAYSRFFDESNKNFEKDGSANYFFIMSQLKYLQAKLISNGYLFLNDVYKQLGFPISVAGQSAGWIYDFDNKENTMLKFEGFDIMETNHAPNIRAFMNGYERSCLLNFENLRDNILTDLPRIDPEIDAV